MIAIRFIKETDAQAFLDLRKRLDEETRFMMLEPGERTTSIEEQRAQIEETLSNGNSCILVAEDGDELVGYIEAEGGRFRRNRHSAHIVIGILQARAGQNLGVRLFEELERSAIERGIHRLELTVMVHNERAIKLYEKMGYEIEGRKKDSLQLNGDYLDEYYMSKIL